MPTSTVRTSSPAGGIKVINSLSPVELLYTRVRAPPCKPSHLQVQFPLSFTDNSLAACVSSGLGGGRTLYTCLRGTKSGCPVAPGEAAGSEGGAAEARDMRAAPASAPPTERAPSAGEGQRSLRTHAPCCSLPWSPALLSPPPSRSHPCACAVGDPGCGSHAEPVRRG